MNKFTEKQLEFLTREIPLLQYDGCFITKNSTNFVKFDDNNWNFYTENKDLSSKYEGFVNYNIYNDKLYGYFGKNSEIKFEIENFSQLVDYYFSDIGRIECFVKYKSTSSWRTTQVDLNLKQQKIYIDKFDCKKCITLDYWKDKSFDAYEFWIPIYINEKLWPLFIKLKSILGKYLVKVISYFLYSNKPFVCWDCNLYDMSVKKLEKHNKYSENGKCKCLRCVNSCKCNHCVWCGEIIYSDILLIDDEIYCEECYKSQILN